MVLTQSMSNPDPGAVTEMKRVLRFLERATSARLTYNGDEEKLDELTAYVDAYMNLAVF